MKQLRFALERSVVGGVSDAALIGDRETPSQALEQAILEDLSTDLQITISGETMHLGAWLDPEHWASDWADTLGVPFDEAVAAVAELIEKATEDA